MEYNLGVDIGGTFTDCVVVDEAGELTVGKSLSTPDNFALGVLNAVRNAAEHLGMTGEEALLHTPPSCSFTAAPWGTIRSSPARGRRPG